jgi:hypothetical protein
MRRIDLKELRSHFVEGTVASFHAYHPARCRPQLLFACVRIRDPGAPRRPQVPNTYKDL